MIKRLKLLVCRDPIPNSFQWGTDVSQLWGSINETTRRIAFFRNFHELRIALSRRQNHATAEGIEYENSIRE